MKERVLSKRTITAVLFVAGIVAATSGWWVAQRATVDASTTEGKPISWQALEGKWVIINYFAEWCSPCLREIPELNNFYRNKGADVAIFMVNYDRLSVSDLQTQVKKYDIEVPVIVNDDDSVFPVSTPPLLPTTYLIDPAGKVVEKQYGEQTEVRLKAALHKARLAH